MKYTVEMGSSAMIYSYIPIFIKIGLGIRKLIGGIHRQHKPTFTFFFFKIRKVG
jgi:hypothetical protein